MTTHKRGDNPYAALAAAGCKIESHESDLYTPATTQALEIVKSSGWFYDVFMDNAGKGWIDVPFAYEPWWEARRQRKEAAQ